ncbi:MAG TPA: Hpt domain-containing protein [Sulfurovum sp.]|nr:Hpt domain-containing protein [Sulfurovum sp.]
MFYIVNHENSIIAADTVFLDTVGANDIFEAAALLRNGEIKVNEYEQTLLHGDTTLAYTKVPLITFFGEAYLYQFILPDSITDDSNEEDIDHEYTKEELLSPIKEDEPETTDTPELEDITDKEEVFSLVDDELVAGTDNDSISPIEESATDTNDATLEIEEDTSTKSTPYGEIIGLAGVVAGGKEILDNLDDADKVAPKEDTTLLEDSAEIDKSDTEDLSDDVIGLIDYDKPEIFDLDKIDDINDIEHEIIDSKDTIEELVNIPKSSLNIKEIAKLIGVSEDEYMHFLDDFSKESERLEPDLRGQDLKVYKEATASLKEAALLLHLPHLYEKLNALDNATYDEKREIIDQYNELSSRVNITNTNFTPKEITTDTLINSDNSLGDNVGLADISSPMHSDTIEETLEDLNDKTINLDDIQAIPFDFSIKEAADELTLPESLVSEFVMDFINQAKENLPILEEAYQDKNLDKVQKTAHMLKGASSNLCIVHIAKTLEELQFNNELENIPMLLELFTGQLKSLNNFMNQ